MYNKYSIIVTSMLSTLLKIAIIVILLWYTSTYFGLIEGWGSSPGTYLQLAASSSYYPIWYYGAGYRYPYYRFIYPYYDQYPIYESHGNWPRPLGYFR